MPDLEGPEVVQLSHDTLDEGGFAFSVFADKGYFLASADGESNVMENIMFSEILTQVLYDNREVSATRGGWETQVETACVFQIHLQPLQFLQLFDAALNLYGFGGFIAEAFDEILGVGNHLLLVLVGAHLLLVALLAELDKPAVVDIVVVYPTEGDLNRTVAYIINECAVVADHEYG